MSSIFKLLNALGEADRNPLTLTAEQAGSTVALNKNGSPNVDGIQYRTKQSGAWQPYTIGTTITLSNVGDYVQFQDLNPGNYSSSNYRQFVMSGKIAASGNIQSMLNYSDECTQYCYRQMFFQNRTSLTSAPELPATTLAAYCYYQMFRNCSSLTEAPELPATTLAKSCYQGMFTFCSSLTTTPELPATTLADSCYYFMFSWCTSLTNAPELPATTLASSCYRSMFYNCSNLTTVPELPVTTLEYGCYWSMFYGCTSLTSAPELPATTLVYYSYQSMFAGCTSLTKAPELPATTLNYRCYAYMFKDCTSLTTAPELPATTLNEYCYQGMFEGCTSLTSAPELPATISKETRDRGCYYRMFYKCTSLTTAPELPATTLVGSCYQQMFRDCTNLNYIKVGFSSWYSNTSSLNQWVQGVSSTGTFEAPAELPVQFGVSRIPEGWAVPNRKYIFVEDQEINQPYNDTINYKLLVKYGPETLTPTFTIVEGSLPAGLSLDSSTGIISGNAAEPFQGEIKIEVMLEELSEIITLTIKLNNFRYTTVNNMKNDSQSYNEATSDYTNYSQGVSMSSRYSEGNDTTAAFQACDSNLTTKSRTASEQGKTQWWKIQYVDPIIVKQMQIHFEGTSCYLQASKDSINWVNLIQQPISTGTYIINVDNSEAYEFYRIYSTAEGTDIAIYDIKFGYNIPDNYIYIPDQFITGKINQDISKQLKYRLYPETLTPTFTIVEGSLPTGLSLDSNTGIISGNTGTSYTGEIKIKVECLGCETQEIILTLLTGNFQTTPHNLTSNTSDSRYVLSQISNQDSRRQAFRAMDGRLNEDGGESHTTVIEKPYWKILFNEGKAKIISFAITNRVTGTHNYLPYKLQLQGSNDNNAWTTVYDIVQKSPVSTYTYEGLVNSEQAYQYWRIYSPGKHFLIFGEIEFTYQVIN